MLSMITAKSLASAPTTGLSEEEEEEEEDQNKAHLGHVNEQGAWCWREGCDSTLRFHRAWETTAVDMYAHYRLLEAHESDAEDVGNIANRCGFV